MLKTCTALLAGLLMGTTSTDVLAQSLEWRVSETAGQVTIRRGDQSRPAQRGATLASGDTVETGGNGRAVLVHARDFVTVAANSRVAVPAAEEATGLTKLMQYVGNAVYRIQKLGKPHFGVKTPYLAAVVKGTTFSVTVGGAGTSLQVTEGLVEVATPDGGARDLIRPGAVAMVAAADVYRLRVQGEGDRTIDSPARPAGTPAAAAPAPTVVVALSAPAQVGGSEVAPAIENAVIGEAIASKPVDLGAETRGLVTGSMSVAAEIAAVGRPRDEVAAPTGPAPVADVAPPVSAAPAPDKAAEDAAAAKAAADAAQKAAEAAQKAADEAAQAKADADREAQRAADAAAKKAAEDAARAKGEAEAAQKAADEAAKAKADADREAQRAAEEAAKRAAEEAKRAADAQAEADRIARDRTEADRIAREKVEADRAARERAEAERAAQEQAEAVKAAQERAEADKAAREKADADKAAKEKADKEKQEADDEGEDDEGEDDEGDDEGEDGEDGDD